MSTKCETNGCHRQAYYTTTCEACLLMEIAKLKAALHVITNQAHPLNMEIFNTAMDVLGLKLPPELEN